MHISPLCSDVNFTRLNQCSYKSHKNMSRPYSSNDLIYRIRTVCINKHCTKRLCKMYKSVNLSRPHSTPKSKDKQKEMKTKLFTVYMIIYVIYYLYKNICIKVFFFFILCQHIFHKNLISRIYSGIFFLTFIRLSLLQCNVVGFIFYQHTFFSTNQQI